MSDLENTLEFAERLVHQITETYCSELQRRILRAALQEERKTYDQIAEECGYSARYVKQDIAPKLWQLLSQAINEKVTKSTARILLEVAMNKLPAQPQPERLIDRLVAAPPDLPPDTALKPTILLVDDQPQNLRLLSDLLDEQGYEVQQAINGTIALKSIAINPPDLILLDISLPDVDGYTVCQRIKDNSQTQDIPVIFVSALDEPWDKVKAFSSGGSDYIAKPFKVVEVLARVENQLKIQQLQQQLKTQNIQLQQAIQELQRLAAIDELTQVASRRRFDTYLLERWKTAEKEQLPLTLMLVQLDNFNFYGEGKNAKIGDFCLYQIAQKVKQTAHGLEDLVARYGTLTFALVLPGKTIDESILQAEKIIQQVQRSKTPVGQPALSLSIGIASLHSSSGSGLEGLIERCDRNLQIAKSKGGNTITST
ncbi:MAG: response regulator [Phormidesmis sp.]